MIGRLLVVLGGVLLLVGLFFSLLSNRLQMRVAQAPRLQKGIYGDTYIAGLSELGAALAAADWRFKLGAILTALGVLMQTVGALLM